jgi:hypothetical protein
VCKSRHIALLDRVLSYRLDRSSEATAKKSLEMQQYLYSPKERTTARHFLRTCGQPWFTRGHSLHHAQEEKTIPRTNEGRNGTELCVLR